MSTNSHRFWTLVVCLLCFAAVAFVLFHPWDTNIEQSYTQRPAPMATFSPERKEAIKLYQQVMNDKRLDWRVICPKEYSADWPDTQIAGFNVTQQGNQASVVITIQPKPKILVSYQYDYLMVTALVTFDDQNKIINVTADCSGMKLLR